MHLERLQLMRELLVEVIDGTWRPSGPLGFIPRTLDLEPVFDLTLWGEPNECGFTACAIGHALLDARFQDQGLRDSYQMAFLDEDDPDMDPADVDFIPFFEGQEGFQAAASFFDIAEEDARHLFDPNEYADPSDPRIPHRLLDRLDTLIAKGEPNEH